MKDILRLTYSNDKIHNLLENFQAGNVSLSKNNLDNLSAMIENYVNLVNECLVKYGKTDIDPFIKNTRLFECDFVTLAKCASKLNEGFYNPFDNGDDIPELEVTKEYQRLADREDNIGFRNIHIWDPRKKQKIRFAGDKVIACTMFSPGDLIEEAPVKIIDKSDMYSKFVRENSVCIDSAKNSYAVPFGYVTFYRTDQDVDMEPNAEINIVYDGDKISNIEIKAIKNIKPKEEIIISKGREFDNTLIPGDYDYKNDPEPVYSFKNFRFE